MSQFAETTAQVARARELHFTLAPLFARTAALIRRSRELCTVFRRISGSSDLASPLIVEAVAATVMCLDCLAKKTDVPPARVSAALQGMQAVIGDRAVLGAEGRGALRRYGPCAACGRERLLCGLAR